MAKIGLPDIDITFSQKAIILALSVAYCSFCVLIVLQKN